MQLPIFILAAGASRRLGQAKQLVKLNGETLIHRQCRIAIEAGLGKPALMLGCEEDACLNAVMDLRGRVTFVSNGDWEEGMAGSLRTAANLAGQMRADGILILHVDQYAVTADGLRTLAAAWQEQPHHPCGSRDGEYTGPPMVIPRSFFPAIGQLSGDQGARSVLRDVRWIDVSGAGKDLDTPEDLARLSDV